MRGEEKAEVSQHPASTPRLPVGARELTSFVGRRAELEALRELVSKKVPLVSVVGPPGMARPRIVRRLLEVERIENAVFCDLRGVESAEGLAAALAEAFDGHLENGQGLAALVDAVGELLISRGYPLIVLDNFEQLVPSGIKTLHHWLRIAPRTTFVVTSRRMLHLRGERVYELPPLGLPSQNDVGESDSTRLFIDRAKAIEPAFDESARVAIDALVRRLEGLPLALELAAGQMRHLRPSELLSRLQETTTITLKADEREVDPRHVSLRSAIESSWRLLEPFERSALSQLTAFRQGFTLEAATAVVDLTDFPGAKPIREVITALREATLLRVDDRVASPAPLRWDMYEAIREFSMSWDRGLAADRHAAFFLARGKDWVGKLGTTGRRAARSALMRELGNVQAAFDRFAAASGSTDPTPIAELGLVLYETQRLSRPALAISPLTTALERVDSRALRTRLFTARGVCHRRVGDPVRAQTDFAEARRWVGTSPLLVAELDLEEAILDFWKGDIRQARSLLNRAVDTAQRFGSPRLEGRARTYLAIVLTQGFQDPAAGAEFERAFRLADQAGDVHGKALNRTMAAACQCAQQSGKPIEELETLVADAQAREDRVVETFAEQALGILYLDSGELVASERHLSRALEVSRTHGLHRYQAYTETWLAAVAEAEGVPVDLDRRYQKTAETLKAIGDHRCEAFALLEMSAHAAQRGELERARGLLRRGEETGNRFGDASMGLVAELQRARVELVESHSASELGDSATAKRLRRTAEQRVSEAKRRFPPEASDSGRRPSLLGRSPEARWAWHLFHRELAAEQSGYPSLRIWSDGSAFQLGNRPIVELPNGPMIRAVMRTLAEERAKSPGHAISVQGFMRRCWADEQVSVRVGSQRVRSIVARLRKAGLADVLHRDDSGYYLVPEAEFSLVEGDTQLGARGLSSAAT